MKIRNRKYVWPLSLATGLAVIGVIALVVALTGSHGAIQAQGGASESDAMLAVSLSTVEPGSAIWVKGTGFRVGTEASFIYTSTITIGDVPIVGVARVQENSAYLHAGRTTDSGLYIAEHIDIDPAGTTADGTFVAQFVLPDNVAFGDQELMVTSCWGGPNYDQYPQDNSQTCATEGLGGGVNDLVATATITIE